MINLSLVSLYNRQDEFPSKYSLGAMRLAAFVKRTPGVTVKIIPARLEENTESIIQKLNKNETNTLGLSAYIWTKDKVKDISEKSPEKIEKIIIGGPEAENLEKDCSQKRIEFVSGEGEIPLQKILISLKKNEPKFKIKNIDKKYPYTPLYSEEFMEVFEKFGKKDTKFTWYDTAVGCTFKCGFCGHRLREGVLLREDKIIKQEIQNIGTLGFKECFIIDPILPFPKDRDKKILDWYNKYAPNTKISAYYRSEFFFDYTIDLLSRSNIKEIIIGIQTLNPNVPLWLRSNNLEKVNKYLPELNEKQIPSKIELIVGLPGDNFSGLRKSLKKIVEKVQPTYIRAYPLTVIRNTKLESIVDADKKGSPVWVRKDSQSKAIESNSYSKKEMDKMVIYSSALTSLYNVINPNENITFKELENRVNKEINLGDLKTLSMFKRAKDKECKEYWITHR